MANVRLFAGAAAAVGTPAIVLPAPDLFTLRELLVAQGNSGAEHVLRQCSFLVDGVATIENVELSETANVDVLPPFAGG